VLAILAAFLAGLIIVIGAAYLSYRMEWKGMAVCAIAAIAITAYAGASIDIPVMAAPFVIGCAGGFTFKRKKSFGFYLIASSITLMIIFAGYFYYLLWFRGVDLIGMFRAEFDRILATAGAPADLRMEFLADFDASRDEIVARVPFSAFLNGVTLAAAGYIVIRRFFARITDVESVAGLEMFRMNDHAIFALIAGLAAYLLVDKTSIPVVHSAGFNLIMAMALLYVVQALGVAKYLLIQRGMPRVALPLGIALLVIAGIGATVFFFVILAGVGALDVWADFRRIGDAHKEKL